jgi:hypothetical protein
VAEDGQAAEGVAGKASSRAADAGHDADWHWWSGTADGLKMADDLLCAAMQEAKR